MERNANDPASRALEAAITKRRSAWLVTIATLPTVVFTGVVLHPCHLVIRRRRDQAVLVDYKDKSLSAAADHFQYISGRLDSETVLAFCSEYEIALDQLV